MAGEQGRAGPERVPSNVAFRSMSTIRAGSTAHARVITARGLGPHLTRRHLLRQIDRAAEDYIRNDVFGRGVVEVLLRRETAVFAAMDRGRAGFEVYSIGALRHCPPPR